MALARFSRPHTVGATLLQVSGLFLLAGAAGAPTGAGLLRWLAALAAALAANIYIVGLNQLADVEIDRINKPRLPLASGELAGRQARRIVAGAGLLSLAVAASQSSYLLLTVALAMLIGTLYSLPPLHLKARPAWAALSIAFVRGVLVNLGLFAHFHGLFRPAAPVPWLPLAALAAFFFGFGLVIALYKDIPDLRGDRAFGVRTFTVRLGPGAVFRAGRWLLTAFYGLPIAAALLRLPAADGVVLLLSHLAIVGLFWARSRSVNPANPQAITSFYLFLWSLFYLEYVMLGLSTLFRPAGAALA